MEASLRHDGGVGHIKMKKREDRGSVGTVRDPSVPLGSRFPLGKRGKKQTSGPGVQIGHCNEDGTLQLRRSSYGNSP